MTYWYHVLLLCIRKVLGVQTIQFSAVKRTLYQYPLLQATTFQHAVHTPLTVAKCNLEELLQTTVKPSILVSIKKSLLAIHSIEKLIEGVSMYGGVDKKGFNIITTTQEVVILLQGYNTGTISFMPMLCNEVCIRGDAVYFQEAVSCLIKNAIEAYPQSHKQKLVVVNVILKEQGICLSVTDFGNGMTPVAKTMAVYQGISYKKTGKGLGLHLVKYVFENMFEGSVHIMSQKHMGTTVTCFLPHSQYFIYKKQRRKNTQSST